MSSEAFPICKGPSDSGIPEKPVLPAFLVGNCKWSSTTRHLLRPRCQFIRGGASRHGIGLIQGIFCVAEPREQIYRYGYVFNICKEYFSSTCSSCLRVFISMILLCACMTAYVFFNMVYKHCACIEKHLFGYEWSIQSRDVQN